MAKYEKAYAVADMETQHKKNNKKDDTVSPFSMFLKIAAEAARASTPPGSAVNQVASGIKQGIAFLDGLTADTPVKQAQTMAALLSEYAYANSTLEKERLALTIGNTLMLALEGAQHIQAASQPVQINSAVGVIPPWFQSYQHQSAQFTAELQRQVEEQRQTLIRQLQQQTDERERELAALKRRLEMSQE